MGKGKKKQKDLSELTPKQVAKRQRKLREAKQKEKDKAKEKRYKGQFNPNVVPYYGQDPLVGVKRAVHPEEEIPSKVAVHRPRLAHGTLATLVEQLKEKPKRRDPNALEMIIWENGLAGVPYFEIARLTGRSESEVREIFMEMLDRENSSNPAEMRSFLTAQMKRVLNYVQGLASSGSIPHVQLLIQAVERLAKMHDVEAKRGKEEMALFANQQALVMVSILTHAIERIIDKLVQNNPEIPYEVINEAGAAALEEVGKLMNHHLNDKIEM